MSMISLKDLGKSKKLNQGLPKEEERAKFREEVVLGKDGVYLSYLTDFFDVVYQVESFKGSTRDTLGNVGVPTVEPRLTIAEKIPSETIHKMVAWYRHVNELYGTEATMQVFYDKTAGEVDYPQELKDKYQGSIVRDGNFVYVVPEQSVTGGFVTFAGSSFPTAMNKELYEWTLANYEPILNIHSHNSMNAFWSSIDDDNELPLYNRLCLVVGKVNTDKPEFRFSWNFEGKRHHYEANIDTFIQPLEVKTSVTGLGYEEVQELGFDDALGYLDYDQVDFDERWDDRIRARGRFGKNFNKYEKLSNLDEKDYKMTAEESRRVQLLEDDAGVGSEGSITDQLDSVYSTIEQDDFYDDETYGLDDDFDGELENYESEEVNDTEEPEQWVKDLKRYKDKLINKTSKTDLNTESKTIETDSGGGFQNTFRNFKGQGQSGSKKSTDVFGKFKRDQIKKERESANKADKYLQSSIWDDVER